MSDLTAGDRVRIATRDTTAEDMKSKLYFAYYGGLTGTILKQYSETELSVEVEQDSLTTDIRRRHDDIRRQMKTKWLDGLSEEGRNKLTEREKDFRLRYIVLVRPGDLEKIAPRTAPVVDAPEDEEAVAAPVRKSLFDFEQAEAQELARHAESKAAEAATGGAASE